MAEEQPDAAFTVLDDSSVLVCLCEWLLGDPASSQWNVTLPACREFDGFRRDRDGLRPNYR